MGSNRLRARLCFEIYSLIDRRCYLANDGFGVISFTWRDYDSMTACYWWLPQTMHPPWPSLTMLTAGALKPGSAA